MKVSIGTGLIWGSVLVDKTGERCSGLMLDLCGEPMQFSAPRYTSFYFFPCHKKDGKLKVCFFNEYNVFKRCYFCCTAAKRNQLYNVFQAGVTGFLPVVLFSELMTKNNQPQSER